MKYILVIILVLSGISLEAQQNRFVFFQAQSGKPFYVRMGADNYSSSSFGHLVIPRLKDTTYHFFVGFPKNEFPEREFVVELKGKDRGFDIRLENQSEVILYEWQSGSIFRHSGKEDPSMAAMRGTKRSDPYALLMAGVVNDPLVLYMQEPVKEEVASTTSRPVQQVMVQSKPAETVVPDTLQKQTVALGRESEPVNDSGALATTKEEPKPADTLAIAGSNQEPKLSENQEVAGSNQEPKPSDTQEVAGSAKQPDSVVKSETRIAKDDPVVNNRSQSVSGSQVIRLYEETVAEGKRMLFVDNSATGRDSIDILIVKEMPATIGQESVNVKPASDKQEKAGLSIVLANSNCTQLASEQDIDRLRVQMLRQKSDDDRVFVARRLLRSRCMSAAQVRALSELFPTDEGRYMFFDAAYPFVSDSGNFKELIQLLSDPYYINRFKAMVRM